MSAPIDTIMRWSRTLMLGASGDYTARPIPARFVVGFIGQVGFVFDGDQLWIGRAR